MSQTVYAFSGTNGKTNMVDDGDINFTGTWSSSGTYAAATKDTVIYGSARFIALQDNVNSVPTATPRRNQSPKWASLVVVRSGTNTHDSTNVIPQANIDWSLSDYFYKRLSADTQFTFSNVADADEIKVLVDSSGSNFTSTWPTVSWPGGTIPAQTPNSADLFQFISMNGTIYGLAHQDMA